MHISWSRSLILAVLNCGLTTAGTSRGKLKCAIHTHPMNRPDQSKAKETEILPVLHFPLNKQSKCKAHCYGGLFTFLVMVMMMHFREEIPVFFPFTCWQMTYFILPSSKKRTATFIKYFIWVMYYCQSRDLVVSSTFIHVKPWHLRFAGFHRFHSSYSIPISSLSPPIISCLIFTV